MRQCQPRTPAKFAQFNGSNFQEIIELVVENSKYSVLADKGKCALYTKDYHSKTCEKGQYLIWLDPERGFIVLTEEKFRQTFKEEVMMTGFTGEFVLKEDLDTAIRLQTDQARHSFDFKQQAEK
jgi:hypothetical protein